jgi:hypothetical protein
LLIGIARRRLAVKAAVGQTVEEEVGRLNYKTISNKRNNSDRPQPHLPSQNVLQSKIQTLESIP